MHYSILRTYVRKYIHTYTYHVHTYIHTHTHTHIYIYIHTYIHTYTHTHTHTHIYIYIHTYRFKLRDDARCICGQNDQTMDHLLFHYENTNTQREVLKHQISQQRNSMEIKQELISKHTKVFCELIESTDFELLQQNEQ